MRKILLHPQAISPILIFFRSPLELAILYLTESVNLRKRRDVAIARLGKPGQIKDGQIVSFTGTFHTRGGSLPAEGASVRRPCHALGESTTAPQRQVPLRLTLTRAPFARCCPPFFHGSLLAPQVSPPHDLASACRRVTTSAYKLRRRSSKPPSIARAFPKKVLGEVETTTGPAVTFASGPPMSSFAAATAAAPCTPSASRAGRRLRLFTASIRYVLTHMAGSWGGVRGGDMGGVCV